MLNKSEMNLIASYPLEMEIFYFHLGNYFPCFSHLPNTTNWFWSTFSHLLHGGALLVIKPPFSMWYCTQLDVSNTEATSTAAFTRSAMFAVLYRQQCEMLQTSSLNNSDWTIITQHFSYNIYLLLLLLTICCFTEEHQVYSVECYWVDDVDVLIRIQQII